MTLTFPNSNVTAEVHRTEVSFVSIRSNEPGSKPVVLTRNDAWDLLIHFLAVMDKAKEKEV